MSNTHVPTNTSSNGLPLSIASDSMAIDTSQRPEAPSEAADKLRHLAQLRKSEGFHTSEKLEQIDKELAELEEQRSQAEIEMDNASVEYANGTKGAQETVSQLRETLKDCEDKTDALQRARQAEQDRLEEAYRDKLERAKQMRRDQIQEQTDKITKSLEKLEKDAEKLQLTMKETQENLSGLLSLVQSPRAGHQISSINESINEKLGIRLGLKAQPTGPGRGSLSLKQAAPRAKPFLEMATIPDYLTDLPDPDAD